MATLTITNADAEDLAVLVHVLWRGENIGWLKKLDTAKWSFSFGESASRFNERDVVERLTAQLNEVGASIDRIINRDWTAENEEFERARREDEVPSDGDVLDEIGGSW